MSSREFVLRTAVAALIVLAAPTAWSAPDIAPGAPEGTCCRVSGMEGSSYLHSDGTYHCKGDGSAMVCKNPAAKKDPKASVKVTPKVVSDRK